MHRFSLTPDGRYAFSASGSNIALFDLKHKTLVSYLSGHFEKVTCSVLNPVKYELFSASHDRSILCWNSDPTLANHQQFGGRSDQKVNLNNNNLRSKKARAGLYNYLVSSKYPHDRRNIRLRHRLNQRKIKQNNPDSSSRDSRQNERNSINSSSSSSSSTRVSSRGLQGQRERDDHRDQANDHVTHNSSSQQGRGQRASLSLGGNQGGEESESSEDDWTVLSEDEKEEEDFN